MSVLLTVQGLSKAFGPRPLFTELALELRAGQRIGLIGPNGSGKSTLLKLIAGRDEPDAGTRALRGASFGYFVATHDRAFLRAVADEVIEMGRVYPGGYFRSDTGYDDFADRRQDFLDAQERQEQTLANQVRRETEWLGRKAAART